jgi:hypothetical protein
MKQCGKCHVNINTFIITRIININKTIEIIIHGYNYISTNTIAETKQN